MDEVVGLLLPVAVLIGVVVPRPWGTNVAFLLAASCTFVLCIYFWNDGAVEDGLFGWKPLLVTAFGLVVMGVFRPVPWRPERRSTPGPNDASAGRYAPPPSPHRPAPGRTQVTREAPPGPPPTR